MLLCSASLIVWDYFFLRVCLHSIKCVFHTRVYVHRYQKPVFESKLKLVDTHFSGCLCMLCRLKFCFKVGYISVFGQVAFFLYIYRAVPPDFCFTNIRLKTSTCCKSDFRFLPPHLPVYSGDEGCGNPVLEPADGQRKCPKIRAFRRMRRTLTPVGSINLLMTWVVHTAKWSLYGPNLFALKCN